MEPSKGRIVNYHCLEGERHLGGGDDRILPAIITDVLEGPSKSVNLIVFTNQPSSPVTMRTSISYGMTNGGGWTWPVINRDKMINQPIPETVKTAVKVG